MFPDTAPSEIEDSNHPTAPEKYELLQNYPNPFNASTTIAYHLPRRSHVRLAVYNILGQQIETIVNGVQRAGAHTVIWDTSHLASGIYFYKLQADNFTAIKKCGLIK